MRRLINHVGGLEQFSYNDSLGRGVAWYAPTLSGHQCHLSLTAIFLFYRAEFHYATSQRDPPPYRYVPTNQADFPEALLLAAAKTSPSSLINLQTYGGILYNIFRRIHRLGLATDATWAPVVPRVAISNSILDTEYDMLLLSSQLDPDSANLVPSIEHNQDLISIADALVTSAQIFAFVALRSMPIRARVVEIYLLRLRRALERPNLVEIWQEHCSLEALLWTLFVSACAASGRPERFLIIAELRTVSATLHLKGQDAVKNVLKDFAWSDSFQSYNQSVCYEVFRRQTEPTEPVGLG
jgi:hypothetical protein